MLVRIEDISVLSPLISTNNLMPWIFVNVAEQQNNSIQVSTQKSSCLSELQLHLQNWTGNLQRMCSSLDFLMFPFSTQAGLMRASCPGPWFQPEPTSEMHVKMKEVYGAIIKSLLPNLKNVILDFMKEVRKTINLF